MEAIVDKKSKTIDQLIGLSTQMIESLSKGKMDDVDLYLQNRASLFSDLEYFDDLIKDRPTQKDQAWIKQLQWIQSKDKEIQASLELELSQITQELRQGHREKIHLMSQEMLEAKGNRLETKA